MFDFLTNTSFYLAVLSLITSLVTLLTLGHVTTLVQRLRNSNVDEKPFALSESGAEELLKRELNLELGENGRSTLKVLNYVHMSMWGFGGISGQQKGLPTRTPSPTPPPSIGGSYFSVLNRTQPKPISMAKLIMSRHAIRKSPPRPRMPRQQPLSTTSLRNESRPISS